MLDNGTCRERNLNKLKGEVIILKCQWDASCCGFIKWVSSGKKAEDRETITTTNSADRKEPQCAPSSARRPILDLEPPWRPYRWNSSSS